MGQVFSTQHLLGLTKKRQKTLGQKNQKKVPLSHRKFRIFCAGAVIPEFPSRGGGIDPSLYEDRGGVE